MNTTDRLREVSILLADVTGSTSLYSKSGDSEALNQIRNYLGHIRRIVSQEGGSFIHSKGDDVLCTFKTPAAALMATRGILSKNLRNNLSVHAGLHHGVVIRTDDDIYGDCVNVCARLASLANPGEALMSQDFVDQLPDQHRNSLRVLDDIQFKGKDQPIRVYTVVSEGTAMHTEIGNLDNSLVAAMPNTADMRVCVELTYGDQKVVCSENTNVTIGRSDDNDLVIPQPWVSRQHATISVLRNKAQLIDRSSGGTYIIMGENPELPALRETVLLIGSGTISPTLETSRQRAEIIRFNVVSMS